MGPENEIILVKAKYKHQAYTNPWGGKEGANVVTEVTKICPTEEVRTFSDNYDEYRSVVYVDADGRRFGKLTPSGNFWLNLDKEYDFWEQPTIYSKFVTSDEDAIPLTIDMMRQATQCPKHCEQDRGNIEGPCKKS